ncbi:DUF805 domain-containing protein [Ensifer sp. PDNC004]|uniref:DUF805 domain-containing protein n=1 Tax=Ensifer sp. PDNC004 TaxID=2811423 RepID=UPI001966CD05|nr:DUF805 domain-containing protein [Ensifer sp. PDNC004]QRY68708.1 DUF805 domain-containing protein [Ensifer sp. PDNC004]
MTSGRMGRQRWWLMTVVLWGVATFLLFSLVAFLASTGRVNEYAFLVLFYAILLVPFIVLPAYVIWLLISIRRWHDLGQSGWWNLILVVPGGLLVGLIVLGFVPGDEGTNSFGAPIVGRRTSPVPDQPRVMPVRQGKDRPFGRALR